MAFDLRHDPKIERVPTFQGDVEMAWKRLMVWNLAFDKSDAEGLLALHLDFALSPRTFYALICFLRS